MITYDNPEEPLVSGADEPNAVSELQRLGYPAWQAGLAVACAIRDGLYTLRDHVVVLSAKPGGRTFEIYQAVPGPLPVPVRRRDPSEVRERLRSGPLPPDLVSALITGLAPENQGTPLSGKDAEAGLLRLGYDLETARAAMTLAIQDSSHDLGRHLVSYGNDAQHDWFTIRLSRSQPDPEVPAGGLISARVLADVQTEATRAHAKHGENSMHGDRYSSVQRLSILAEEGCQEVSEAAVEWALDLLIRNGLLSGAIGTIAHDLNEDVQPDGSHGPGVGEGRPEHLYTELVQTAAMACTWAQRLHELIAARTGREEPGA